MVCPECHAKVPDHFSFCPRCGLQVKAIQPDVAEKLSEYKAQESARQSKRAARIAAKQAKQAEKNPAPIPSQQRREQHSDAAIGNALDHALGQGSVPPSQQTPPPQQQRKPFTAPEQKPWPVSEQPLQNAKNQAPRVTQLEAAAAASLLKESENAKTQQSSVPAEPPKAEVPEVKQPEPAPVPVPEITPEPAPAEPPKAEAPEVKLPEPAPVPVPEINPEPAPAEPPKAEAPEVKLPEPAPVPVPENNPEPAPAEPPKAEAPEVKLPEPAPVPVPEITPEPAPAEPPKAEVPEVKPEPEQDQKYANNQEPRWKQREREANAAAAAAVTAAGVTAAAAAAAQQQPAQQPAPAAQQQPAQQPAPAAQQQPAQQPAPAAQQQPAQQPAPAAQQQPAQQPAPAAQQQPAQQPAPAAQQQPAQQPAPAAQQQSGQKAAAPPAPPVPPAPPAEPVTPSPAPPPAKQSSFGKANAALCVLLAANLIGGGFILTKMLTKKDDPGTQSSQVSVAEATTTEAPDTTTETTTTTKEITTTTTPTTQRTTTTRSETTTEATVSETEPTTTTRVTTTSPPTDPHSAAQYYLDYPGRAFADNTSDPSCPPNLYTRDSNYDGKAIQEATAKGVMAGLPVKWLDMANPIGVNNDDTLLRYVTNAYPVPTLGYSLPAAVDLYIHEGVRQHGNYLRRIDYYFGNHQDDRSGYTWTRDEMYQVFTQLNTNLKSRYGAATRINDSTEEHYRYTTTGGGTVDLFFYNLNGKYMVRLSRANN